MQGKIRTTINTMVPHRPTSWGKTRPQIFFHRSFGFLACREVASTSVVQGDPNMRVESFHTGVLIDIRMLLMTVGQQHFNRLPIWLKESEPAGMMRGFVMSMDAVFLIKK